jgi:hydrogenase nickel incorporation protein HypA/HybF
MHELSIAMSLLDALEEEAERRNARVIAAHVRLGPLSGVVKEALVSAFEMARQSTLMANCQLVIEDVPIVVFCPMCDAERPPVSMQEMRCSFCGTPTPRVITGSEMELKALEIES